MARNTCHAQRTFSVQLVTGGGARVVRLFQSVGYRPVLSLSSNLQVLSFILSPYAFVILNVGGYHIGK